MNHRKASSALSVLGLAVCLTTAGLAQSAHADVILYEEIFSNSTGSNAAISTAAWTAYAGVTDGSALAGTYSAISKDDGRPTSNAPVNSTTVSETVNQTKSYAYFNSDGTANGNVARLAYTTETNNGSLTPIDISQVTSLSTYACSKSAAWALNFALKIAGNWYVSTTGFTPPIVSSGSNFSTQATLQSLTLAGANWSVLNFDPGVTAPAIGAATSLPTSGTIQAFGVFAPNPSRNNVLRFDSYTINGTLIPEPATLALLAVGGLLISKRKR